MSVANPNTGVKDLVEIWKAARLPMDYNPRQGSDQESIAIAIERLAADDNNC